MALKSRREAEREVLRARLMDAARDLFATRTYEEVSLRTIGKAAGYSAPTVLNHFGTKEALILAICVEDFLALRSRFERLAEVSDPVERLRRLGLDYVDFAMSNPNHYRFMFMTRHPFPQDGEMGVERSNPDQDAYAFLRLTVAEAVATGRLRDDCRDPDVVAQMLWSAVHGLVSLHLNKADDPCLNFRPVDETARLLVDAMIRGLLAGGDETTEG